MEVKATINYKGAAAYYSVTEDTKDIYSATLVEYKGSVHNMPPVQLIITKGVRHWIGSIDDDVLINDLGGAIDINVQSGVFLNYEAKKFEEDKEADEVSG
jgi:hypothetical protein